MPAVLAWGTGRADFAVNRRENKEEEVPALREALALKGPVDHDVPVLRVINDENGGLMAIVCGYACHCTVLDGYQFSGDYAGFAQISLEKAHPGTQAMFVAGCGADQNPIPRRSVELAEKYGGELAVAVDEVLASPMHVVEGDARRRRTRRSGSSLPRCRRRPTNSRPRRSRKTRSSPDGPRKPPREAEGQGEPRPDVSVPRPGVAGRRPDLDFPRRRGRGRLLAPAQA